MNKWLDRNDVEVSLGDMVAAVWPDKLKHTIYLYKVITFEEARAINENVKSVGYMPNKIWLKFMKKESIVQEASVKTAGWGISEEHCIKIPPQFVGDMNKIKMFLALGGYYVPAP